MKLKDILNIVEKTAKENNLSKPYIVGGFPRDILLKKITTIKDIDITCGDITSLQIGMQVVGKLPESTLMTYNDKHSKLTYKNFSIDFSSNFIVPNISKYLQPNKQYSSLQKELYSRDFTINTLLMPLDLSTIVDVTNRGIADIKRKIIDTCLEPNITLGYDPKRIVRVIYLSAKLDFRPSKRVSDWIRQNGKLIEKVSNGYIKNKINKALSYNKELTINLLHDLNLMNYIPNTSKMIDIITNKV